MPSRNRMGKKREKPQADPSPKDLTRLLGKLRVGQILGQLSPGGLRAIDQKLKHDAKMKSPRDTKKLWERLRNNWGDTSVKDVLTEPLKPALAVRVRRAIVQALSQLMPQTIARELESSKTEIFNQLSEVVTPILRREKLPPEQLIEIRDAVQTLLSEEDAARRKAEKESNKEKL